MYDAIPGREGKRDFLVSVTLVRLLWPIHTGLRVGVFRAHSPNGLAAWILHPPARRIWSVEDTAVLLAFFGNGSLELSWWVQFLIFLYKRQRLRFLCTFCSSW